MTNICVLSQKLDQATQRYQTHYVGFWEKDFWTIGIKDATTRWQCTHQIEWRDPPQLITTRSFLCGESGTVAEAIRVMCDLHPPENHIQPCMRPILPVQHPLTDGLREITSRTVQFPGLTLDWNVKYFCPFALRVDKSTRVPQLWDCRESDHDEFHQRRMFSTTLSHLVLETAWGRSRAFAFPKNPKLVGISGGLPKPIESIVRRYLTENEMTISEFRSACNIALQDMEAGIEGGDATLSIEARGSVLVVRFSSS